MARPGRKKFDVAAHLEDIERLAGLGLNQLEICQSLGFHASTLHKYKKQNKDLSDAIKRGRAAALKELTSVMYEAALKEKNITAAIFMLKGQFGWRDHGPLPGEEEEAPSNNVTIQYIEMDGRVAGRAQPGSSIEREEINETKRNRSIDINTNEDTGTDSAFK